MSKYDTTREVSDQSEYDSRKDEGGTSAMKSDSTKNAQKLVNQQLLPSTRQKNPVKQYGYNEYMAHHYAY